jgi:hypothetical protein
LLEGLAVVVAKSRAVTPMASTSFVF